MKRFLWFIPILVGTVFLSCKKQPTTPETGSIQVNSIPTGASIWLDNTDTGKKTNCLLENISVGEHSIKLTLQDYADYDTTVVVCENETTTVNTTLTPTLTITATGVRVNNGTQTHFTYRFNYDNHLNHLYITFPNYGEHENPADAGDKVANTDYHSYFQAGGAQMPTGNHTLRFLGSCGGSAYEKSVTVNVQ
ncbi:MAG: PEGA domain-containing protein [bacterium]|nr:PEGA domain-containing protein [bacterium]